MPFRISRLTVEHQDALDQQIGVFHLAQAFAVHHRGEPEDAPVLQDPRMQEVLIDGGQLVGQDDIELL